MNIKIERLTEYIYAGMMHYIEDNQLDMIFTIYHICSDDEGLQYVDVKIAVDM
ncbi:DUF5085 family protein [Bacillus rhizoplanae]|uniref:DUF5085 family protein n=1 Tax=Bacillus rhizoplanae TaxID=2880966 RepID=UPI003D2254B5